MKQNHVPSQCLQCKHLTKLQHNTMKGMLTVMQSGSFWMLRITLTITPVPFPSLSPPELLICSQLLSLAILQFYLNGLAHLVTL